MQEKNIRVDQLDEVDRDTRAETLRKLSPVAAVRNFYTKSDAKGRAQQRSRKKSVTIFTGADALYLVSEGNPRWFKGISQRLLRYWDHSGQRVPMRAQSRVLREAGEQFSAMLGVVPLPYKDGRGAKEGLLGLTEKIGDVLHKFVIENDFDPEPPLSFRVDRYVSDIDKAVIGQGLNVGALIYLPGSGNDLLPADLEGSRMRLSFILAAKHGIPLRLGRSVGLTQLLKAQSAGQLSLLDDLDD